jgi:hypothetical protein
MNNEKQLLPEGDIFKLFLPKKRSVPEIFLFNLKKWRIWNLEKWLRFALFAILFLILCFALLSLAFNDEWIKITILILYLAMYIVFVIDAARLFFTLVPRQIFEPEREVLDNTVEQFSKDLELARFIARSFEQITIEFAQQKFVMLSEHLTQRISLMVGVIESLGLIPMGITAYLTYKKLELEGSNLDLDFVQLAGFLLVFLYVVAHSLRLIAQELLRHSLVLKTALNLQQQLKLKNIK